MTRQEIEEIARKCKEVNISQNELLNIINDVNNKIDIFEKTRLELEEKMQDENISLNDFNYLNEMYEKIQIDGIPKLRRLQKELDIFLREVCKR